MEPSEVAGLRERAVSGDTAARERLIAAHRDFILWAASATCRRSVNPDQDDEWSIALIAFNEAIDTYKRDLGANFLSHAFPGGAPVASDGKTKDPIGSRTQPGKSK
ncbi:MAG: hypothetical protein ACYC5Y_13635 [Symbiobacteriia bacterium]